MRAKTAACWRFCAISNPETERPTTVTTIAPPPQAPSTAPPPLSPSGRTAIRVVLTAAAAVLVLGTVAGLSAAAWGLSTFRVITDTQSLPTAMRSLVVDTGKLPIAVRITADRAATNPVPTCA